LTLGALGVVALLGVVVSLSWRAWDLRRIEDRDREVNALVASSVSAERSGRVGEALRDLQAGLDRAVSGGVVSSSPRLEEWRRRRDALARRDLESRLEQAQALPPSQTITVCQTLLKRCDDDAGLKDYRQTVLDALERARQTAANADLEDARQAWSSGHAAPALAACERALARAGDLSLDDRRRVFTEVRETATAIANRCGVVLEPIRGKFQRGSVPLYQELLGPTLEDALRQRGYLPRPDEATLRAVWDEHASYRVTFQITESDGPMYLHSVQPIIQIGLELTLYRGEVVLWSLPVYAKTRSPVPGLSAFEASRIATAQHRTAEIARRLDEDARAVLLEAFRTRLRNLPAP
jgi:hypothetical protein